MFKLIARTLATVALAGVIASAAAQQPLTVSIGFNPTQNSDQLSAAANAIASYLEKQFGGAVEVKVYMPTDYRGLIEAMGSGNLDFAFFPPDGFVIANQEIGAQVLLKSVRFGNPYYWSAIVVRKDSGITKLADLEGKSIATSGPGGFNGMLFRYMLRREGLEPEVDVQIVPVGGSSERAAAVMAGQVQATVTFIDNWLAMEEQGADVQLLGYVADLVPGLSSRAVFAEREYLEQNEDLATAIACANLEVNAWINSGKDSFVAYTTENVRGADENAVAAFYDVAMDVDMFPTDPDALLNTDGYQSLADLMYEGGELEEPLDVSGFVDGSYLEAAAEMGCGGA